MIYVMSDIHGCYEQYLAALKLIQFSDQDTLYVLGDVVDRGPQPIKLLQDMMMRPNVIPILGNHEYMAHTVLKKFCVEITDDNAQNYLTTEDMLNYQHWIMDGGQTTIEQFRKLSRDEQMDIIDYLEEFMPYDVFRLQGQVYLLVHGGFEPFDPDKHYSEYELSEMLFQSPDYSRVYYPDKIVINGHTPTGGKILRQNNHIAVDCGCVFGGKLGVLCLDNGQEYYI